MILGFTVQRREVTGVGLRVQVFGVGLRECLVRVGLRECLVTALDHVAEVRAVLEQFRQHLFRRVENCLELVARVDVLVP